MCLFFLSVADIANEGADIAVPWEDETSLDFSELRLPPLESIKISDPSNVDLFSSLD